MHMNHRFRGCGRVKPPVVSQLDPSSVVKCLREVFVWGVGVLFLSCACVSVSGVLFSVGVCVCARARACVCVCVCVCDLVIFLP